MSSTLLDDRDSYSRYDPQGMAMAIESFPQHCRDAMSIAERVEIDGIDLSDVRNIFVLGMGGSGVSGDIAQALCSPRLDKPLITVKDYVAPMSLGPHSLVFAVSYSGNTEETINALREAEQRNAQIIAITSGGQLERVAKSSGFPMVKIPGGLQPRAALGYLAIPLLVILDRLFPGKLKLDFPELFGHIEKLANELGRDRETSNNQAKRIALRLSGRLPIIYGCAGTSGVAALRWKTQINENSKSPAYAQIFSELDHNEIVGWSNLSEIGSRAVVVILKDDQVHAQNLKRIRITKELIGADVGNIIEVEASGSGPMQQLFSLIYLGDFVSLYLALLYNTDPTPVDRIEDLKRMLTD